MRQRHSDYMLWAKTQGRAKFNLATSGVGSFPLRDLPVTIEQLEINGDSTYGYAPLQNAIAKKKRSGSGLRGSGRGHLDGQPSGDGRPHRPG